MLSNTGPCLKLHKHLIGKYSWWFYAKKKTIIYPASCLKDWELIDLLWGSGKKSNKSSYCGNHDSIKMDKEISDPNINKGIPCLLRKISEKISHFFHLLRKPLIIFIKYYFIGMLLNQFIWRYV